MSRSTEDKLWWVKAGLTREHAFVTVQLPKVGLTGQMNPAKEHDPFALDLIVEGNLADLKCQRHPFFTAGRYGMDPIWTVTFNAKDYRRYDEMGIPLDIYFWVDWQPPWTAYGVTVEPLTGIWGVPFRTISNWIDRNDVSLHTYQHRLDDEDGNARDSYLLDLHDMRFLKGSTACKDRDWKEEDGELSRLRQQDRPG